MESGHEGGVGGIGRGGAARGSSPRGGEGAVERGGHIGGGGEAGKLGRPSLQRATERGPGHGERGASRPREASAPRDGGPPASRQARPRANEAMRERNERKLDAIPSPPGGDALRGDRPFHAPGRQRNESTHGEGRGPDARADRPAEGGQRRGDRASQRSRADSSEPKEQKPWQAGATLGEVDAQFALGRRDLVAITSPPDTGIRGAGNGPGDGSHRINEGGSDGVYVDRKTEHVYVTDNKSHGRATTVRESSALTTNRMATLQKARAEVAASQDHPYKQGALDKLDRAIEATRSDKPMPNDVHLVVTNAGGHARGISRGLRAEGLEFWNVNPPEVAAAHRQDVKTALRGGVPRSRLGRSDAARPSDTRRDDEGRR